MQYKVEYLQFQDQAIIPSKPTPLSFENPKKIAIIVHVFYIDVWEEMQTYLNNITQEYDLFVTIPDSMPESSIKTIFQMQPSVHLYRCENRGRDVLPFLQVMKVIGTVNYKYICKLHTKKTGDSLLGHVWRKVLYFDLIGSNKIIEQTIELFEKDPSVCIVTGGNVILSSQEHDYGNDKKVQKLLKNCGLELQNEHYLFAGGTMFWIRSEILTPLVELFKNNQIHFEQELGQTDHTIAHAIERLFGVLCTIRNGKILPSPSNYQELDQDTLNLLTQLILSKRCSGKDIAKEFKKLLFLKARKELYRLIDIKNWSIFKR